MQTQVIDVTSWAKHEEFPVFPVGSKPKKMLLCPSRPTENCLIPGHSYLFKIGVGRFQQQAWSEVIAYRIGILLGLPVPPCFIAEDKNSQEIGALIEFFYGHPGDSAPTRFIHASEFMTRILVDKKKGRPHRLPLNLTVSRALCGAPAQDWWAKAVVFDALIGNTDRHPENWGFLFRHPGRGKVETALAPLFDNGTSLAYEVAEAKLISQAMPENVEAYIQRGKHHCGWQKDGPLGHFELCREFLKSSPKLAIEMREILQFDLEDVKSILEECVAYDTGIKFSRERAALVFSLVKARKAALVNLLEG
ncbi:HipA domain-containing protein [Methylocystis parvus]|uniref:HipA domain-containing protein n=1 Tax=Methylocystis parvus TaxID=134 RepID=UPI003C7829FA